MSENVIGDTSTQLASPAFVDYEPGTSQFLDDVLDGLNRDPKEVPCKYFYDERGSQLFDQICGLDEYYPTRTEIAIMEQYGAEMAHLLAERCLLIEYGSGSSTKTPILLRHMREPVGYVPIDISREHLLKASRRLQVEFPELTIKPVCADYTRPFELPWFSSEESRRVVYYPGSTIGNFHPHDATDFLRAIAELCGQGGGLLLGVDLVKPRAVLETAYNDRDGITAEFNLNLLKRINRELRADFTPGRFEHRAVYNPELSRIEMHLRSQGRQVVSVAGKTFAFQDGETILTECSYKYTFERFAEVAGNAGFRVEKVWTDDDQMFSVQYLTVN